MYRYQSRNHTRSFAQPSRFKRRVNPRRLDTTLFTKKASGLEAAPYISKHAFSDFSFYPQLAQNIVSRGYTTPTPIQDQAIPELLAGRDVVGIAKTGTGKTAAFLLPLLTKVFTDRTQKVLIIAPTRELAVQIDDEFRLFSRNMKIFSSLCIGGVNMGKQIFSLRREPNFVIGTPGRLIDLARQGQLSFSRYKSIVLDEVDRMLDMGFIRDVQFIISKLPEARQSLCFSATISNSVKGVMQTFLKNPVTISIQATAASDHVNQDIIRTNGKPKIDMLHDLLISDGFDKVLLFGRTKWGIEKLQNALVERGFKVASIHGNKSQSQRLRALDAFRHNQIQILLATDIASRGLDIDNVTHVINYDPPESYDDYIHRIGRTGRADKSGMALTFVD